jgi:hypothetical protein
VGVAKARHEGSAVAADHSHGGVELEVVKAWD